MVNDLIGKTLNKRYHIQKLLGDGGHGEVFLGQDQELQRLVALKRLRAPDSSAQLNARFRQEAHIMAKLAHPNIVPIFDVFEDEGRLYLVMEYSETGSLKDFLARHSALSLEEIIELGKSVARALQAAHDQSIIHRDVKPGNVLLKRNGEGYTIQLTDFSIAHQPHNDTQLTQTGDVLGTPLYLAPEQITSRAVTKTDIYALAVMLYLLLTGHHYLDLSGDEFDKRRRIIQEMPRPLIEVRPDVPEWLNALIMQALAKNPAERPSVAQFYTRLHTQGTADRLSPQTPKIQDISPAMQPRPLWLQKGLIAVTTWAVVALVLVLAYRYQSGASPLAPVVPYTPTEAAPVITTTVQSVSGVVNVRSAPDLAAAVVGQLADGTAVTLQAQDESGSWFYLTDGQLAGWMYADYLAPLTGEVALGWRGVLKQRRCL